MQLQEFLGQVQHQARMSSLDEALSATRATLETLSERLQGGEPENLGAQLPGELKLMLDSHRDKTETFSSDDFLQRISEREGVDLPASVFHTRAVLNVLKDAVTPGTIDHVRDQLPADYQRLFEAGSEGKMPH
ncbi:DUF2267 domain-containing protein [Halochromatium sp.]